ncbi:MAG: HlyD family efflux transporter periplasmic adaptor subunit, partial [bacterium]
KRKIIISFVVLIVVGACSIWFWKARGKKNESDKPQTKIVEVSRGDIVQKVAATGRVVSNIDVEIKCKASGEIVSLPYDVSDMVTKGSLVLELDPTDEGRNVKKAKLALMSSRAKYEKAKHDLEITKQELANSRKQVDVNLEAARIKADDAQAKKERIKQLYEKKLASKEEYESAETAAAQAQASYRQAQIRIEELKTEEAALELKRQDLAQAAADVGANEISLSIAEQRLKDTRVYSPIDGVITERKVQAGQIIASGINNVGGGTSIMTISDLSRLYVLASVDESEIGRVRPGQNVVITADAFPGKRFKGRVERIAQMGMNVSDVVTFEVKIEVIGDEEGMGNTGMSGMFQSLGKSKDGGLENTTDKKRNRDKSTRKALRRNNAGKSGAGMLKSEMTADIGIIVAKEDDVLIVPSVAVFRINGKQFVTVVMGNGKTEQREVETGLTDGEKIEVLSGLKMGEKVQVEENVVESRWSRPEMRMMPFGGGGSMMRGR